MPGGPGQQPLTLGRRPWCTRRHPLSWSGRTELLARKSQGPMLEGTRAERRDSARSPSPTLLLGSGPTGRTWSRNARAQREGGWQQSPRGPCHVLLPQPGRSPAGASPCMSAAPHRRDTIILCTRVLHGTGTARSGDQPTFLEPLHLECPRNSLKATGPPLWQGEAGLTRISSPSLVSSLVQEVLGPSPFRSLCSQTILFSLSHFTRLCERGAAR